MKGSELKSFIVLLYCNIHTWYDFEVDITNCCKDDHVFLWHSTFAFNSFLHSTRSIWWENKCEEGYIFFLFLCISAKNYRKTQHCIIFSFLLLVNACWFLRENLHFLLLFFFLKTLAALKILLQDFNHDKTVLFFASTFSLLWYSIHIDISRRTHYDGVEFFDDSIMIGGLHRPRYTVVFMTLLGYQFSKQNNSEWEK